MNRIAPGPTLAVCDELHAIKYRSPGENFREAMNRVAKGLADDDGHYHAFREILLEMRFMPAGRIQNAIGSLRATTPYNCYVSGTIADSYVTDEGSIMDRAKEAAATMRMGGGIGYDFSTLRPAGDIVRKLQSQATGPRSFMDIFNAVCLATASSGHRRGAQMGVLRVDHPDIETFIHAKQNTDQLTGFNISVGVTDAFMEALATHKTFMLQFEGRDYREVDAEDLWEQMMRSTWDWAEPGVLFIDTINRMNNLWYCEKIAATNPCGEQPLPPYGACLLGSFNLARYLTRQLDGTFSFDWAQFKADIAPVVRAMDNVVDVALYPLPAQGLEARSKRRMGLGVTGLANCLEAILGRPAYGDADFLEAQGRILDVLRDESYSASVQLAMEKGAFDLFDTRYASGEFIKTLPPELQADIKAHGIRNSHLTSIAPTGTISFCADNVSSGIEPVFEYMTQRPLGTPDGPKIVNVPDYGYGQLHVSGRTSSDVTVKQHLDVLISAALRVDSAVSKTCNVPGDIAWEDFKGLYVGAYEGGAKGATTFNKDGKRMALLTSGNQKPPSDTAAFEEGATCEVDQATGRRSCE